MKVSVIGLGYVGLPLAALLARTHSVVGFDVDEGRIRKVKAGEEVVKEPGLPELLKKSLGSGRLHVTSKPD